MKRLTGSDAMMLYVEAANVPMHTVKIAIVDVPRDGDLSAETLRKVVGQRLHRFEPFRRVLVDTPHGLHRPMWRENCPVDLDYHVQKLHLPAPGGRRELDDAVAHLMEQPLDRTRPLWEIHVIDGLADGRIAVVTKMHHALADGVASSNLLAAALDRPEMVSGAPSDPKPSWAHLLRSAMLDHVRQIAELPSLFRYTAAGIRRARKDKRNRARVQAARSFTNHRVTNGRRFATASVPFADAKRVTRELGCTINDLILAMSAGAARELRIRYDGHSVEPLLAMVPVCLDATPGRTAGNNFDRLAIALPTDADNPVDRIARSHEAARNAKHAHVLRGPELASRWMGYMPPFLARTIGGWMARTTMHNRMQNLVVSNVPGPREHVTVAGATIDEFYSMGPLVPGSGLNITVWSYAGQLNISVLTDTATVEDAHEVTAALVREFADIASAAKVSTRSDQEMYRANVA